MSPSDGLAHALAAHGKPHDRLVVQLTEYKGHRLLDIRKWYVASGTKEWRATTKGLSLTRDAFEFVMKAIQADEKRIHRHFAGEDDTHLRVVAAQKRQAMSAEKAGFGARAFEVKIDEWSGQDFFQVEGGGAKDVLRINARHPVGKTLIDQGPPPWVVQLLLSFGRACRFADGGEDGEMADTLELLVANWGLVMRQYLHQANR